jgi:hypothetical protein
MLPLFDRAGEVRFVLTVAADSPDVSLVRAEGLPRIPWLGRIRLPDHVPLFREILREDVNAIRDLWHFDPWWLIAEPRFATHWARELLMSTNLVGRTKVTVGSLYYRRDLSQVKWFTVKGEDGFHPWNKLELPEKPKRASRVVRAHPPPRWILDPIWTRR